MSGFLFASIGVAWIGTGPFLAWFMGRRGYDTSSWLAVGCVLGPSAIALAVIERASWTPPEPEVVVRGKNAGGSLNVLVLTRPGDDIARTATSLIDTVGNDIGRLSIARILPEGGPLEEQRREAASVKHDVERFPLGQPEGLLLFGRPEEAVRAKVLDGRIDVVVTSADTQRSVADRLRIVGKRGPVRLASVPDEFDALREL